MLNQDNIDQKIFFNITNNYYDLYESGEITKKELDQVLDLLEKYKKYKPEEFQKKLKNIFE